MFFSIIIAIIILSAVLLTHELGHFLVSKFFKVKVEEFGFGFPPRAIKLFKKNGTLYTLNWIPFGGFNKILGEDKFSKDPQAYNNQAVWRRWLIAFGGVLANIVLAWLILVCWLIIAASVNQPNYIAVAQVNPGSAAERANLKTNDIILSLDGAQPKTIQDVSSFTRAHAGGEIKVVIRHQGKNLEKNITLSQDPTQPLGVMLAETGGKLADIKWYRAPVEAFKEIGLITETTFVYLGKAIVSLFGGPKVGLEFSGPIGIIAFTSQATFLGWLFLLRLGALISLGLAIFNILPLPAADGGRLTFLSLEGLFGKKIIHSSLENAIHAFGFILLIALSVLIAFMDIKRLL